MQNNGNEKYFLPSIIPPERREQFIRRWLQPEEYARLLELRPVFARQRAQANAQAWEEKLFGAWR